MGKVEFTNNLVHDSKEEILLNLFIVTDGNLYDPNNGIDDLINKELGLLVIQRKELKRTILEF